MPDDIAQDFLPGDIAIGGDWGYVEHIRSDGTFVRHIPCRDNKGNLMSVLGLTFSSSGHLYAALGKRFDGFRTNGTPHDLVWKPDNTGFVVVYSPSPGTAKLRHTNLDGLTIGEWTIVTDTGWRSSDLMKVDITCDSKTVYYSDRGRTVFRFSLDTQTQLSNASQRSETDPRIYAAFKLFRTPEGRFIVAESATGNGPRNAICYAGSENQVWTDEINPGDFSYEIFRRSVSDLSDTGLSHTVSLSPDAVNSDVFSLACYYNHCAVVSNNSFPMAVW